jgi:hypothetical protein
MFEQMKMVERRVERREMNVLKQMALCNVKTAAKQQLTSDVVCDEFHANTETPHVINARARRPKITVIVSAPFSAANAWVEPTWATVRTIVVGERRANVRERRHARARRSRGALICAWG